MNFNTHFDLVGRHAFLSPSNHHWLSYDVDKLRAAYYKSFSQQRGTELHALASQCIRLGINLPKNRQALNQFVNDAIGFRMASEQILFYSYNAFGTADAISFRKDLLRIHDLKTGYSRVMIEQLEVYAALFCLEYDYFPDKIDIELRIYQSSNVIINIPDHSTIRRVMEKIKLFDKVLKELQQEDDASWMT